ncbi:hypothetical protein [Xylanibacter oryzae]|uniref:hypothetical protein n=1 Tax=Xylanibacter oryzae TaxID=185293 RepID=UPI0004B04F72|nr:hypothetical protein [Xylanibacter oryzae]
MIYSSTKDGKLDSKNSFQIDKKVIDKHLETTVYGKSSDEFGGAKNKHYEYNKNTNVEVSGITIVGKCDPNKIKPFIE